MDRRKFIKLVSGGAAAAVATRLSAADPTPRPTTAPPAAPPSTLPRRGLLGEYGFISSSALAPQPDAEARARIAIMATKYAIREFQFYDWFADYSTAVRGDQWNDPWFRKSPISRRAIEVSIDEIHRHGGRAWAYVQAVGAEEKDLEDAARGIQKLRTPSGEWHWHAPGPNPRFPTYFANAAWAAHMVERWAGPIRQLGFDGVHWDTLGPIAGGGPVEAKGIHDFLRTAQPLLAKLGMPQTLNWVGVGWWDRAVVRDCTEFPYVETWRASTANRLYAEMDDPYWAGRRGVFAMYPSVGVPGGWTETQVICARHREAHKHRLVYLLVGDGARRMKGQYWPETVPLTAEETLCLQETILR